MGLGEKRIDRTDEWRKFVYAQKVPPVSNKVTQSNSNNSVAVVPINGITQERIKSSQFNAFAADISKDINDVGLNLLKLAELSKKKNGIFIRTTTNIRSNNYNQNRNSRYKKEIR